MSIIVAILILNLLIAVHELGHFLAAKVCGVGVDEFSLGMGPKIISKEYKGTIYSVRWILIGGFVKLNEDDYPKALWWKQLIIILAGVLFNFLSAFFAVSLYLCVSKSVSLGFSDTIVVGFNVTLNMIKEIFAVLVNMFKTVDTSGFAGPVGIVDAVSTYVETGFIYAIEIFAVLNINLFVMNLVPISMLDGGQAVLILIKRIFNKDEMPKFELVWNIIGYIFIGIIFFFAIKNDVLNFFK